MISLCLGECNCRNITVFLSYAYAKREKEERERRYQYYLTDALYVICENTAMLGGDRYLSERFYDVLYPAEKENRTGEELLHSILSEIRFS